MHTPPVPAWRRMRQRLATAALAGLALITSLPATAQDKYPLRPIRIVVPFGPGGLADITMRVVGQKLAERVGQQVVIDNRPGAGGIVAATTVLTAPRDGHTLVVFANGTAIGKSLMKLPYDPVRDFTPISTVAYFDLILLTRADGPLRSVADILGAAKKQQLTFGTITAGSTQNLSAELFKSTTNVDAAIVPYKGTPDVLTALMRGEIDVGFESYAALKGAVDAGQVRAIASTGAKRSASLPAVPTVTEAGVRGYDVTGWNALYAPAGTPAEVVHMLNQHLAAVLAMPDVQQRLRELGTEGRHSTPADMAALFRRDADKWEAVIKRTGIQVQ